MNGDSIALDTNQAIRLLNSPTPPPWLEGLQGHVALPAPVLGELYFGAMNSKRRRENLQRIELLLARTSVLTIGAKTAEIYAHMRLALKRLGKPLPENDIWIAAVCFEHSLPLATSDAHFDHIPELKRVQVEL